jgi:hypothetical protein
VKQYQALLYNVYEDTLRAAFPVASSHLVQEWDLLIRAFMSSGRATDPQLWAMPLSFADWFAQDKAGEFAEKPFLPDLLYFEWREIEIENMEDGEVLPYRSDGNIEQDALVLNPDFVIEVLSYPVHKKITNEILTQQGNYYILIFRDHTDYDVHFVELSVAHALALSILEERPASVAKLSEKVTLQLQHADAQFVYQNLKLFFSHMLSSGFVLGFSSE